MTFGLWNGGQPCGTTETMPSYLRNQYQGIFSVAALGVWLAIGWPFLRDLATGSLARGTPMPALWLVPFGVFGAAVLAASVLKLRTRVRWTLVGVEVGAVLAMATIRPSDLMAIFLIVIAWQVAMTTGLRKALVWVALQTAAIAAVLAMAPNPDLPFVVLSLVLQLCFVFTAHSLRREEKASQALAQTNRELRAAQAIIANTARDAERLRISRELHDAWGHELTALGLQLEIASHVSEPAQATDHVLQAKRLARGLLAKVRDVVAVLRRAENAGPGLAVAGGEDGAGGLRSTDSAARTDPLARRHDGIFCAAALAVGLALGWPVLLTFMEGGTVRGAPVSALWLVPFAVFGAAVLAAIVLKPGTAARWTLLGIQVAAVAAMAYIVSWAGMALFLAIVAWQVARATTATKSLAWVGLQTLAVTGALAVAPNPDLCWVIGKSFALQLFFVFTAQALRREAETGRALGVTNRELRAAQAVLASTVRDAERLRISRELHDGWGHELTALGLQLEIASHVGEPARANGHVLKAKGLARDLLGQVRDVVAMLRETERCDLKDSLERLAQSVPTPAVHVEIAPEVRVAPDQAHALMRCAQEAITNAVKHAHASNLWLRVTTDCDGVRLVARNDGSVRPTTVAPGSGLAGMRERLEALGGKLAVRMDAGFTVDAWLPSRTAQAA
jgi:signal transduction histidine kinase